MCTIKLFDIVYDTECPCWENSEDLDIPKEMTTTPDELGWSESEGDLEEYVMLQSADFISDRTGWCVISFRFSIDK